MSIPTLGPEGVLPPGVHDADLSEVRDRFGRFQSSDRRPALQRRLEAFLLEVEASYASVLVYVDGSFVTGKPDPEDIDLILELPPEHEWAAALRPAQYNVLSKRRVKSRHGFDLLVAPSGSAALMEYIEFFSQVRDRPDLRKGILRVRA